MILRGFQKEIAEKINNILFEQNKRFVGAKVPTGGGKSFLFMNLFIEIMNQYDLEDNPSDDILSNVPIKYYTPTTGIVSQTRINIIKNIVMDKYIEKFYNGDVHDSILKIGNRMIDSSYKNNKLLKANLLSKLEELYTQNSNTNENPENIIKSVFENFLPFIESGSEQLLKKEFPNLELVCYKKIEDLDVDKIDKNTKLIVFDEAHRTGSKKWGSKAKDMIKKLDKTKFLSITATPERDVDGIDPMELFATLSGDYDPTELRNKEYLASDMTLVEALEKDLVVKPKVVSFDCCLDETKEYKDIKNIISGYNRKDDRNSNVKDKTKRNSIPGELRVNMYSKLPTDNYHILLKNFLEINKLTGKLDFLRDYLTKNGDKEYLGTLEIFLEDKVNSLKSIDEVMSYYKNFEGIKNKIFEIDNSDTEIHKEYEEYKNQKKLEIIKEVYQKYPYLGKGKHICFAPTSSDKSKSKKIMHEYRDKIIKLFGIPAEDVLITHSNPNVISEKEDRNNFSRFMLSSKNLVMVAMNKFNEGLHVGGVIALEVFREINKESSIADKVDPNILFSQIIGRCIYSKDERSNY